jgi:predicted metal-dependent TIM-barrel fold hydrolase
LDQVYLIQEFMEEVVEQVHTFPGTSGTGGTGGGGMVDQEEVVVEQQEQLTQAEEVEVLDHNPGPRKWRSRRFRYRYRKRIKQG